MTSSRPDSLSSSAPSSARPAQGRAAVRRAKPSFCRLWPLALVLAGPVASAQVTGLLHQHGVVKVDVSVEGPKLTVALEAPLDNLLGFERAPRTDAERAAAATVLARLRAPQQGAPLFRPDAAAQCTLAKAEVAAPVLEPGPKAAAAKGGHADLDATYEFTCAQPQQLRVLDLGLFEAYPRIQRIQVQVAGPKGQAKASLKRPNGQVALAR